MSRKQKICALSRTSPLLKFSPQRAIPNSPPWTQLSPCTSSANSSNSGAFTAALSDPPHNDMVLISMTALINYISKLNQNNNVPSTAQDGREEEILRKQAKGFFKNQEAITVLHSLISTAIMLIIKRDGQSKQRRNQQDRDVFLFASWQMQQGSPGTPLRTNALYSTNRFTGWRSLLGKLLQIVFKCLCFSKCRILFSVYDSEFPCSEQENNSVTEKKKSVLENSILQK